MLTFTSNRNLIYFPLFIELLYNLMRTFYIHLVHQMLSYLYARMILLFCLYLLISSLDIVYYLDITECKLEGFIVIIKWLFSNKKAR